MTNLFTASETPPEKKASFVIYIFIHTFNSFTYRINPHYYQLWRGKKKVTFHRTLCLSTQREDWADLLDLSKQVQPLT